MDMAEIPPKPATPEADSPSFSLGSLELAYPTSRSTTTSPHAPSSSHSADEPPLKPSSGTHEKAPSPDDSRTNQGSVSLIPPTAAVVISGPPHVPAEDSSSSQPAEPEESLLVESSSSLMGKEDPVSTHQDSMKSPSPHSMVQLALEGAGSQQGSGALEQNNTSASPPAQVCSPDIQSGCFMTSFLPGTSHYRSFG